MAYKQESRCSQAIGVHHKGLRIREAEDDIFIVSKPLHRQARGLGKKRGPWCTKKTAHWVGGWVGFQRTGTSMNLRKKPAFALQDPQRGQDCHRAPNNPNESKITITSSQSVQS